MGSGRLAGELYGCVHILQVIVACRESVTYGVNPVHYLLWLGIHMQVPPAASR